MTEEKNVKTQAATPSGLSMGKSRWKMPVIMLVVGFVLGAGIVALVGWKTMPQMMLNVHKSRYDSVDRTCEALKESIEANGWSNPAIRNMNKSMAARGVQFERPVRIVELCKAGYAKQVLSTNPEVTTLMPCAWGVYEGTDGNVYISGMNMGLMGKMFGGNIARVMGTHVAADEHEMLKPVIEE